MENHPIPQDITGFEFKLIGDMTLKQFAYVTTGVIIGWLLYISPLNGFIKIPLAIAFIALGGSLAFLPIQGRPMDVMIKNFFIAVFSPTQYVYQKTGGKLLNENAQSPQDTNAKRKTIAEMSQDQLQQFLNAMPSGKNKLDQKETVFFQSLNQYGASQPVQATPGFVPSHAFSQQEPQAPKAQPAPQPAPRKADESKLLNDEELKKTAALLEKELKEAKEKEAKEPKVDSKDFLEAHQKVLELQKNLNDLLYQKQELETKLVNLQKKMETQGKPVYSASMAQEGAQKETKFVRSVPQNMAKSVGLPITPEFPNIITGILKDPRGNPLPNILVEVKDGQGNAVRAFKTNALGQFASATPLVNGDYIIEFEDQRAQNKFDTIGFKAAGDIILPIEVISTDSREELRRSLFN